MSKRVWNVAYVGIGLEPRTESGRPTTELQGAWCLKPYWGKPDVRNFREGGWKRDHGSRTEAHGESHGTATGPYRARASALPDGLGVGGWGVMVRQGVHDPHGFDAEADDLAEQADDVLPRCIKLSS